MFDVTVVIPTRERWAMLERFALRAALAQVGLHIEIVVVDDGSVSDPEAEEDLLPAQVRLIRLPQRAGVAAARNAGISVARAPWVAFLDDDDAWSPERLARMLSAAETDRGDFAYSAALIVDDDLLPQWIMPATPTAELLRRLLRSNAIPAGGSNGVARTRLLKEVGGFDEALSFATDWDLWIRLAQSGPCTSVPEPLIAYVQHDRSWVLGADPAVLSDVKQINRKHAALIRQHGTAIDWLNYERYVAQSMRTARPSQRRDAEVRLRPPSDTVMPGRLARVLSPSVCRRELIRYRRRRAAPPPPDWLDLYRRDGA